MGGLGTDLYALQRQVKAAGITSVTGRLYADDDVFDRLRGVADSGYATSPYIGPLSGLSLNSGYSTADAGSFATDPALVAASKLRASLNCSGVQIKRAVALGNAPEDRAQPSPSSARPRSTRSSTTPTSTRTTSSPRC